MRRMAVELVAMAVLLAGVNAGWGQPSPDGPPPKTKPPAKPGATKSKLEEMIEQALKSNPDLSVAAAKVATAQAELTRTRLQVTQKVVALYYALEGQKAQVATLQVRLKGLQRLYKTKVVSEEEVAVAEELLRTAKAKLAEMEAEQPYLLGLTRRRTDLALDRMTEDASVAASLRYLAYRQALSGVAREHVLGLRSRVKGKVADKLREALDRHVSVNFEKAPLGDVLELLKAKAPGVAIQTKQMALDEKVTGELKDVPLGAVLEWLEDTLSARFVVREYGLLFAPSGILPPGALSVHDFWKGGEAKELLSLPGTRNPPKERINGLIKTADPSGLVTITVGSDAGLAKGNTLDVYRLKPAKYLGTIRLIEVTATQAVGQPLGRMTAPPRAGDHVASEIPRTLQDH